MSSSLNLKNQEETEGRIYHKDGDSAYEVSIGELVEVRDKVSLGVTGTFTTTDGKTVTVSDGIITSIL